MSSRDAPTFEFSYSSPSRPGRKHRRGRGQASRKTPSTVDSGQALTTGPSFRQGGHNFSSVTSNASAGGSALSESHQYLHQHPHTQQANYYTSDAWDNVGSPRNTTNNKDDNSCTGSLTYSASSSVQSAESSNDSSFADIIKLIDSSEGGDGASDINAFIAKNSNLASSRGVGGDSLGKELAYQKTTDKKKLFFMSRSKHVPNVDMNYSKDESSEEDNDALGPDFDSNILETIAGHDDVITSRTLVTSLSIHDQEEVEILPISPPPTPLSRMNRDVTPPPNSRNKRTSTPPGTSSPGNLSRTNSRHSKSSSDGSFDTPSPSSPPTSAKPPHAKGAKKDRDAVEDLSEAFYAKSWMCGFADAFNF